MVVTVIPHPPIHDSDKGIYKHIPLTSFQQLQQTNHKSHTFLSEKYIYKYPCPENFCSAQHFVNKVIIMLKKRQSCYRLTPSFFSDYSPTHKFQVGKWTAIWSSLTEPNYGWKSAISRHQGIWNLWALSPTLQMCTCYTHLAFLITDLQTKWKVAEQAPKPDHIRIFEYTHHELNSVKVILLHYFLLRWGISLPG